MLYWHLGGCSHNGTAEDATLGEHYSEPAVMGSYWAREQDPLSYLQHHMPAGLPAQRVA